MTGTLSPTTTEEVREAVRWAIEAGEPLEVIAGATKRKIAEPAQTAYVLDVNDLSGILAYEPEELILTVRPGTSLETLTQTLADKNQMFAFEPIDLSALLGGGPGTIGGTFGSNYSGPRRVTAGAVRDHMLGVEAVSGRGDVFKAGGKVVKNVTGYDLSRALCGSWGTLAVATELTIKVLPKPEQQTTLVLTDLAPGEAVVAMSTVMGSSADASGAAYLPADIAQTLPLGLGSGSATVLRLEGFGPSVAARSQTVRGLFPGREIHAIDGDASAALWTAVGNVQPFATSNGAVWRVSVAPTAGPAILDNLPKNSRAYLDWAGGLVWIETLDEGDAGAKTIRMAVAENGGGHATLIRATSGTRASVPTFQPQSAGLRALSERLRTAFDPEGILNPGRMVRA
ncbi:MAG: glycolate oxidase subunit GlcE [Pseudomonadota bacterium]